MVEDSADRGNGIGLEQAWAGSLAPDAAAIVIRGDGRFHLITPDMSDDQEFSPEQWLAVAIYLRLADHVFRADLDRFLRTTAAQGHWLGLYEAEAAA